MDYGIDEMSSSISIFIMTMQGEINSINRYLL